MARNLCSRITLLEERQRSYAASQEQPGRSEASRKLWAVLDELARLKASAATYQRAGKTVEGEDIPCQILGDNYTQEELLELAAQRAADAGAFGRVEVPGIVAATKSVCEPYRGEGGR